jgi:transcriptional regulator with XRE-family HTH domain
MAEKRLDVDALVGALDAKRQGLGMSWRKLAVEAGVSPSTLTRIQQGKSPDVNTFAALTDWLQMPAEEFTLDPRRARPDQPHPMAVVSTLLRGKKKMSPRALEALQELVSAAYKLSKEIK